MTGSKNLGGRGKKATYETTHVRVPLPVKDEVMRVIEAFRGKEDSSTINPLTALHENSLTGNGIKLLTSLEAIEIAKNLLSQKKSARISMEKLISAIYGETVKL